MNLAQINRTHRLPCLHAYTRRLTRRRVVDHTIARIGRSRRLSLKITCLLSESSDTMSDLARSCLIFRRLAAEARHSMPRRHGLGLVTLSVAKGLDGARRFAALSMTVWTV